MQLKKGLAGGGIALVLTLSGGVMANAADVTGEEPPEPAAPPVQLEPVNTWSGPFVGVTLGYGFGKTDAAVGDIDTDGVLAGGFAGYNFQNGNFVYGLEGDVGYNAMDGATAGTSSQAGVDGSLRAPHGTGGFRNCSCVWNCRRCRRKAGAQRCGWFGQQNAFWLDSRRRRGRGLDREHFRSG